MKKLFIKKECCLYSVLNVLSKNSKIIGKLEKDSVIDKENSRIQFNKKLYSLITIKSDNGITVGYVESQNIKEREISNIYYICKNNCELYYDKDTMKVNDDLKLDKGEKVKIIDDKVGNDLMFVEIVENKVKGYVKYFHVSKYSEDVNNNSETFEFNRIAIFRSCFRERNGTPRQGTVTKYSKGYIELTLKNNSCLDGLESYSHLWILFVFHKNKWYNNLNPKKIRAPRLGGKKIGVYACRTPHRVNPIGLSCVKIEMIQKGMIFVSGVDLIDNTPIIDIKPYCKYSDSIPDSLEPDWVRNRFSSNIGEVSFSEDVLTFIKENLKNFTFFKSFEEIKQVIHEVIKNDPRPRYLRNKETGDKLYGFRFDNFNIRCSFDKQNNCNIVEIHLWEE